MTANPSVRPAGPGAIETASAEAETRAAFLLKLREQGIRDIAVLRAMEAVPRAPFVSPRHSGFAARDVALPIPCGQTAPEPSFVARAMAGSALSRDMRVLVVGLGSGYATAVLTQLVREVVALDRYKTLVDAAQARFAHLGITNADLIWADALDWADGSAFDRILVFACVDPVPQALWRHLGGGGAIVHGKAGMVGQGGAPQMLARTSRPLDGLSRDVVICPSRLPSLQAGRAQSS